MSLKGAIGKVVGGAVGSVFGTAGAYVGSELGQAWGDESAERKALKQQQNYQLGLWNMQNEYNSPASQMERLKEAGLNPNLAYGNLASGTAGAVGSSGRLNVYQADALNLANAYQDLRLKQAQTGFVNAQTLALGLENAENGENGTSRSTPYPIKLAKSAVNSITSASGSLAAKADKMIGNSDLFNVVDDVVSGRYKSNRDFYRKLNDKGEVKYKQILKGLGYDEKDFIGW